MSSLKNFVFGCVSDRGLADSSNISTKQLANVPLERPSSCTRVKFGVPLVDALKDDSLPAPLVDMLVYIAQEGVTTTDLFRRPGNPTDLRTIVKRMSEGREVQLTSYNFYTLASVIKKFLLKIPGGIFGQEVERQLLEILNLETHMQKFDAIHSILSSLPLAAQHLIALLFGTWFRIVNHSEYNTMSSESVAKSVAGSLFHTCADDPVKVNLAVEVLRILIDNFGVATMFGRSNIEYFTCTTCTGIDVREKYKYEFVYQSGDSIPSLDDCLPLFTQVVQYDVKSRGLDPVRNAITEEDFNSQLLHLRSSAKGSPGSSNVDIQIPLPSTMSSPPSPQSLIQQHTNYPESDPDFNPHKKLAHVSSVSAPEVNQGCSSPTKNLSVLPGPLITTSLNRCDSVMRRQLSRLKKRSNWFLSPPPKDESSQSVVLSSFEVSGGDPSFLGSSSNDGGRIAETRTRALSSIDGPIDELTLPPLTDPIVRRLIHGRDEDAGQQTNSLIIVPVPYDEEGEQTDRLIATPAPSPVASAEQEGAAATVEEAVLPLPSSTQETEQRKDIRYFYVENFYGIERSANS